MEQRRIPIYVGVNHDKYIRIGIVLAKYGGKSGRDSSAFRLYEHVEFADNNAANDVEAGDDDDDDDDDNDDDDDEDDDDDDVDNVDDDVDDLDDEVGL
ncbi:hypothetical protein M0802_003004 [Mischocyttarus mexicanus]|nr:hypothetical protein M0802_003004 [Mischocyttarus mexicanus]